jgi:dihydroorotate dehydrogenase (NAD+) catalytic subunit
VISLITLSNGHSLEYVAASGALGYDGKGWFWERWLVRLGIINPLVFTVVTKTLTRWPRQGNFRWWNPFRVIAIRWNYIVNAVGLKNKGVEWWCKKIGPKVNRLKIALVVSIYSESISELVEMAKMLNPFDLVGIELNLSCPSVRKMPDAGFIVAACREVKKVSRHPLFAKLSVAQDYKQFIRELERIGVEAININSVPWEVIFPKKKSPLARFGGGGVSGKVTQPIVWPFIMDIVRQTRIPVIGSAIWDYGDMAAVRRMGAKAVSFGSVFMPYPWRPASFVKKEMEKKK